MHVVEQMLLNSLNTFSLHEVQKWGTPSVLWAHKIKCKAMLSWWRFRWGAAYCRKREVWETV